MNAERIAFIAATIALGTAVLASIRGVRQEVRDLRNEVRDDMKGLEARLRDEMQAGFKELTTRIANLGDRLSKVEGRRDHRRDVLGRPQPGTRQAGRRRRVALVAGSGVLKSCARGRGGERRRASTEGAGGKNARSAGWRRPSSGGALGEAVRRAASPT